MKLSLIHILLIACVALLVLLLRYRDRSVRLEAESRSWQERAEDRTQILRRAEEVLKDSFAGISAEVLRNSEKQFLNLAEKMCIRDRLSPFGGPGAEQVNKIVAAELPFQQPSSLAGFCLLYTSWAVTTSASFTSPCSPISRPPGK